ncbi:ABC transporter substrate-binding protein [Nonomuraea typhae]|uniref:ABC transporter substrate-binding protein n=1 Tax=Nonomuraea typhae TaxID=2603600 RepID=A0ABW7Z170_9ACTN
MSSIDGPWVTGAFLGVRRRRRWVIAVLVIGLMILGGIILPSRIQPLTDDPAAFGDDLAGVMVRIRQENTRVEKEHPGAYVTIVALFPMSGLVSEITMSRQTIRRGLQGIYVAQFWRNRLPEARPYVKVLVGSNGPKDWEATLADLDGRADAERVVAVTGLGASTAITRRSIAALSERKFAMTAAVITSDEFRKFSGLARVAPLNSDQAVKVLQLARDFHPRLRAVVVKDSNPNDSYVKTLGDYFAGAMRPEEVEDKLTFDAGAASPGTVLGLNAERICNSTANTVLYAGRNDHLPALMAGLSARARCIERRITVISGDDVAELNAPKSPQMWGDQSITLFYTALAHSEGIREAVAGRVIEAMKQRFRKGVTNSYLTLFPGEDTNDGMAIVHHDAMYVAIEAVDKFTHQIPGRADVASMLTSGTLVVDGASGQIRINAGGDAVDKDIPVLQLGPDGSTTFSRWATE